MRNIAVGTRVTHSEHARNAVAAQA